MELYCNYCGKLFSTPKIWFPERFCSPECRESFETKKRLSRPNFPPRNCKLCGKSFIPKTSHQLFCDISCTKKFHNERQKELYRKAKGNSETQKSKVKKTFEDYAREADECGLSYGNYTAQLRLGKTFEELRNAHLTKLNSSF